MGYERKERLTRNILLMLTVGTFSIVPVAEGAPVLDNIETPGAQVQQAGVMTDVTSTVKNNIVNWKDFSVDKGETVRFDKGVTGETANNYLNVVTGDQRSDIRGAIQGGNDVYIVNPQGILIDSGATVNVGNLYLSTTPPENLSKDTFAADGSSPLVNTSATAAGNVVNMGKIEAKTVTVEGDTIKFVDMADVSATGDNVKLTANNEILLGQKSSSASSASSSTSDTSSSDNGGVTLANVATPSTSNQPYQTNTTPENFTVITDQNDLDTTVRNAPSGKYWLKNNISMSGTFAPISSFSGTLDGNYYEIQGLNVSTSDYAGLFSTITGTENNPAKVYDLGIRNATIETTDKKKYAGGLAGKADYADITNVYVAGGTITAANSKYAGGILGIASNVKMESVYNTANVGKSGSGLVVSMQGNVTINNAYNAGVSKQPIYLVATDVKTNTLNNTYADMRPAISAGIAVGNGQGAGDGNLATITSDTEAEKYMHLATYTDAEWKKEISNEGNKDTAWRLYEGETLPLLRAFLKAHGTAKLTYNYTMGDSTSDYYQSGSNNGADLTGDKSLTYNGSQVNIQSYTPENLNPDKAAIDTSKIKDAVNLTEDNKRTVFKDVLNSASDPGTHARYYTDQDGYDLVGNNITISPRTVTLNADKIGTDTLEKTYDGTTAVDQQKLMKLITGNTTSSGIVYDENGKMDSTLEEDKTKSLTGTYYYDGNPTKNVGKGLNVVLSGGYGLANADGYYNYIIDDTNANFDGKVLTGQGQINKATLILKQNASATITRDYTGKNNTAVNDDDRLTSSNAETKGAELFTLTGKKSITTTDSDGKSTTTEDEVYVTTNAADGTGNYGTLSGDTFTPTGAAGDRKVAYSGIILGGGDAGNYKLVLASTDSSGNTVYKDIYQTVTNGVGEDINKDGGTFYLDGHINRKNLSSSGFKLGSDSAVSREYDGTQYYDAAGGQVLTSDEVVTGDNVTFTVQKNENGKHSAYFSKDGDAVSDVGNDYDITYNVDIAGEDAANYQIDRTDISDGGTGKVTGTKGINSITPRILTMGLGTTTTGIDKEYDGDEYVKVTHNGTLTKDIELADNLVNYKDPSDTDHQLLGTDGVTFDIKGTYPSKDVVDANNDGVGDAQNITYTVALKGNDKGNYAFGTKASPVETQSVTGATGAINPKEITAAIKSVSKTFDWDAKTGNQTTDTLTADDITLTTLVSDDDKSSVLTSDVLDALNKNGKYGKLENDAFIANEHVGSKAVRYTGLTSGSKNYKIKNSTVDTTGTINKLTIDNITMKTGDVSKVYDGKTNVATEADGQNEAKSAKSYITSVTTTVAGKEHDLSYTVKDDGGAYYIDKDGNATRNVADVTNARFLLNIATDASSDFALADNLSGLQSDGTVARDTESGKASITPRTVYAAVTHNDTSNPFTKTYDATTSVYDEKTKTGIQAGGDSVTITGLLTSLDGATNQSTGAFKDKNVAYATGTDTITTKDVDYTIKLNSDTAQANYNVYNLADKDKADKTALAYNKAGVLTGVGKITPADLTVKFATVSKKYDGNANVVGTKAADTMSASIADSVITPSGGKKDDVGVSIVTAGDEKAGISAPQYDNANNGKNKNVTYYFTLSGNDLRNYRLTTLKDVDGTNSTKADTPYKQIVGGNSIDARHISKNQIQVDWGTVQKTYDGGTNVAYDHTDTNTYFDGDDVVAGTDSDGNATSTKYASRKASDFVNGITFDNIAVDYTIADKDAAYGDSSAGSQNATFKFQLSKDVLGNYEFDDDVKDILSVDEYGAGTLTESTAGTIKQKILKTAFDDSQGGNVMKDGKLTGEVTKVYNASTNVVTNAQDDVKSSAESDKLLFDGKVTLSGLVGKDTKSGVVTISGAYSDANVAYDQDGNVTSKTVDYQVATNQDSNYTLVDASDATKTGSSLSFEGAGTITKKNLTVSDVSVADKTFDTNANVKDVSNITYTLDGLVDADNGFTLEKDTIAALAAKDTPEFTGKYVDENVNRKANAATGEAGKDSQNVAYYYKGVKYTGFQNVLDEMFKNGKTIAGNYSIADTAYFDEAKKKGVIRPLSITADAVRETWSDITKAYDGDADVENAKDKLKYNVLVGSDGIVKDKTVAQAEGDTLVAIDYDLSKENGAKYSQSDAGKNLTVKYDITGYTGASLGNFVMGDDVKNAVVGWHTITGGDIHGKDVSITPKVIDVKLTKKTDINKVYNAKQDSTYQNGIKIDDGNVKGETNKVTVKLVNEYGTYDKKNASQTENDRILTYKVTLEGNDKGNYTLGKIDDATGKGIENAKDLTATGTISKRKVYVGFDTGKGSGINKEYAQTYTDPTTMTDDEVRKQVDPTHKTDVVVVNNTAKDKDSGIVNGEVTLNNDAINVAYENGHVVRDANGKPTTQAVLFTDIALKNAGSAEDNLGNYEIAYAPGVNTITTTTQVDGKDVTTVTGLKGSGTISPKKISVAYDNATKRTKKYDGASTLKADDITAIQNDLDTKVKTSPNLLLPTDTLNFTVTGDYVGTRVDGTDADGNPTQTAAGQTTIHTNQTEGVNAGELGVRTNVSWTNGDYDVSFTASNADKAFDPSTVTKVSVDATQNPSITFSKTVDTVQGTIKPRQLKVDGAEQAEKTYDGNNKVKNAGKNIKLVGVAADGSDDILTDKDGKIIDDVKTSANGTYQEVNGGDAADASTIGGKDLLTHKVKYKDIMLGNKDYELVKENDDGTVTAIDSDTLEGENVTGIIKRRTLIVKGEPQTIPTTKSPEPKGSVEARDDAKETGWAPDEKQELKDKLLGKITWSGKPGDGNSLYGWYQDQKVKSTTETVAEKDADGNPTGYVTKTIKITNEAGKVLWSQEDRTYTDPNPVVDPTDPTKTIPSKPESVSTTVTRYNPITGDKYVMVEDATGETTQLYKMQEDGTFAEPVKTSLSSWYTFNNSTDADADYKAYKYMNADQFVLNWDYDKNYTVVQDPGNATAVHYYNNPPTPVTPVTPVNPSHGGGGGGSTTPSTPSKPVTPVTPVAPVTPTTPTVTPTTPTMPPTVPDISEINAAKRFVPDTNAYNYASHDEVQSVTRSGQAGLEYASGGINVLGETGTPDVKVSSADNAAIGLQNAGSVVNLSGGDAMEVSASRVDLTGGDSFTITGDTEVVRDSSAAIESAGAQTYEGSAAVETADAGTYDGSAAVESAGARTDLQSTTDASWLFGDEASASERQSGTSSSSASSEDEGSSLFSRSYDDDETAARSAISVMTADDTESAEDTEDAKDKDKDEESKDADSSDAADDSSIGIESEGSGVNVAS